MADRRLRVFYTVARLLSFTKAARALHMTQPAVTFQIRQLEDHLDTRLFDRAHNQVRLTEPGHKVYEYAERIFELYAEMENSLRELTCCPHVALTLGACREAAESLMPALLRDFKRTRPQVNLALRTAPANEIAHLIENGAIDAGMTEGPAEATEVHVECVVDPSVVIVPPGHALAGRDRVSFDVVTHYPLICREKGSTTRELIMNYAAANGLDDGATNASLELPSVDAIKGAVEAGIGIAVVSRSCILRELELGALACIALDPPLKRSFSLVCSPRKSKALEELLNFMRGYEQHQGAGASHRN